jgi:hypothetical protein
MIRKTGFVLVLVTAFIVAACGRQVSPNPPNFGAGGAPAGYMSVKFDVNGQFNFQSYQYWVVFNTSGNGKTPLTNPFQTNWQAYSFALEVTGVGGATFARPVQFVKNSNPAIPPFFQQLTTTPQQFQYIANSNGTGTEFTILFQRNVFNGILGSPSPLPSGSPSPGVSKWLFNAFVTQATAQNQLVFVDSMGSGGATDTTFISPTLPINKSFDQTISKLQDINPPSDPSAQILSIEIANNGAATGP